MCWKPKHFKPVQHWFPVSGSYMLRAHFTNLFIWWWRVSPASCGGSIEWALLTSTIWEQCYQSIKTHFVQIFWHLYENSCMCCLCLSHSPSFSLWHVDTFCVARYVLPPFHFKRSLSSLLCFLSVAVQRYS